MIDEDVRAFVVRAITMSAGVLDPREREVARLSLEYGYREGYRQRDMEIKLAELFANSRPSR